ncbi:MAG: Uma2 family endonuclease [Geminicoccaceae bacterium]|nr:Uma2 family endonuclease [Geminicoccaceae bacterium]MCX8099630.1 Uma2 family endonuclease [Geminicoccaceae bacterium]MDW8369354.1 Uma2 family endonuclease [Geminicoccaceae bacterium]
MAEAATAKRPVTVEEFLAFEGEGDTRYELVDGVIVAMAAPSEAHGTIVGNVWGAIDAGLRDRPPYRAVVGGGVAIDERNWLQPDLVVTCAPPEGRRQVAEPVLVVEVLSESSRDRDLGSKLQRYIALPSVREIWLIDSAVRWVQLWRRAENAWIVTLPLSGEATFRSEVLGGAEIALDALYRNSGL